MSQDDVPVGELYFSPELYGGKMNRLKNALEEAGFELQIDPLQDQAELIEVRE